MCVCVRLRKAHKQYVTRGSSRSIDSEHRGGGGGVVKRVGSFPRFFSLNSDVHPVLSDPNRYTHVCVYDSQSRPHVFCHMTTPQRNIIAPQPVVVDRPSGEGERAQQLKHAVHKPFNQSHIGPLRVSRMGSMTHTHTLASVLVAYVNTFFFFGCGGRSRSFDSESAEHTHTRNDIRAFANARSAVTFNGFHAHRPTPRPPYDRRRRLLLYARDRHNLLNMCVQLQFSNSDHSDCKRNQSHKLLYTFAQDRGSNRIAIGKG